MKNKPLTFSKSDISIEPLEDETCEGESENCTFTITHALTIDLRGAGILGNRIGLYCETCATEIAKRIQDTLPEDVD